MAEVTNPEPATELATEPAKNRTSCDLCKRMKIRCEKQGERCAHCISRDAECVVTIIPRKKRQKKTDYLSTLEDRLMKMEAVITAASSSSVPASASTSQTPEAADDLDNDQSALSEKLSSLYIGPSGASKYIGSSSGFSLFSPQGLEWITRKTGGPQFSEMVMHLTKVHHDGSDISGPEIWYPLAENEREPMPAPEVAISYMTSFFRTLNKTCPIFDQDVFERKYARRPNPSHTGDTAWYAALHVVMALGSLISSTFISRTEEPSHSGKNASDLVCWKYFRNASSLYVNLNFTEPNLMAVQAVVTMAIMVQAIADPQPAYIVTAAAVRLAHSVGLHRKMAFSGLTEAEIDERSNLFWTLYILEQGQSLRSGRPSMIQDDDIGIDLPKETQVDYSTGETVIMGTFHKTVELSHLSSRVYSGLYSAKSQSQSRLDRLKLVGRFDKELEQWRDRLQIEIRPGEPILCPESLLVPVTMLHFQYYFTLTTIHRVSVHHGYWMNERVQEDNQWAHDAQLNPRVFASGALCLTAARNTIRLFQDHNIQMRPLTDDTNLLRMADYYPLAALLTLFANCLQHPQDENAPSDLDLMTSVMSILAGTTAYHTEKNAQAVKVFEEMMRIARLFVTRARSQERHKRTHERLETKEDDFQARSASADNSTPSINEVTPVDSSTSRSSEDRASIPTPSQQSADTYLPPAQRWSYSPSTTLPLVSFDPNTPLLDRSLNPNASVFDPSTFGAPNLNASTNSNVAVSQPDMNGWWPSSISNNQMPLVDSQQQVNHAGSYNPFETNLDDQDLLMGWDTNAYLPMSMTFQWDLADLWTGKGKAGSPE